MKLLALKRALTLAPREHLRRAQIFVRTNDTVPASRTAEGAVVGFGTGTRLLPTVYDALKARRRRRRLWRVLSIGVPTLLASVYYGLIASDRYVSDTQMVLSQTHALTLTPASSGSSSAGGSSLTSLAGLLGGGGDTSNEYMIVNNFLTSAEAMQSLDRKIGLRRMWSADSIDFLSRLSPNASQEDFQRYFQHHLEVVADPTSPVIELKVQAFSPADAQLIGKTLVQLAQQKLNEAHLQMQQDALAFARSEVDQSQQKLKSINDQLRDFRNAHGELDLTANAGAVGTVVGGLFGQLASTEADLRTALSYARDDSPTVTALKARIAALRKQIAADRQLLAGDGTEGKAYADLMSTYGDLLLDQQFAQAAYTSAMAFLSTSRADLEQHHTFLIDFLAPTLPEDSTEPRSWENVLLVLVASALVALTGSLIAAALREHAHL